MMRFIFLLLVMQISCASTKEQITEASILKPKDIIRACAAEQIDLCGDLICEGDLIFEQVIAGTAWAITNCFEDSGPMSKEYFNPEKQREVFKNYNVESWFE